jgi:hypothetical protein
MTSSSFAIYPLLAGSAIPERLISMAKWMEIAGESENKAAGH